MCKIVIFFLAISFDHICSGCSKESSQRDGSFEHPKPMFWLPNKIKKLNIYLQISGCLLMRACIVGVIDPIPVSKIITRYEHST